MGNIRKCYNAAFKARVVLEALKGGKDGSAVVQRVWGTSQPNSSMEEAVVRRFAWDIF